MNGEGFQYDSYKYFFDLICLCVVLLPYYYLTSSEPLRRALLAFAGVYLTYFIAPRLALFYLAFWICVFLLQRAVAWAEERQTMPGTAFALATAGALTPMLAWKLGGTKFVMLFNYHLDNILLPVSYRLWEIDLAHNPVVPVGLSFATFRALDLLVKTWLGKFGGLSFGRVMCYGFFPPVLASGPIIEYEEIAAQGTKADPQAILEGALRVCVGALKVFYLATALESSSEALTSPHDFPVWMLWIKLISYSWYFYINFSGYSDMAIGVARIFGFSLKENFDFPYFKPNIQEFWNSWHMSLSRWAQRNVFVPAGGYRAETQYIALFLTIMTIALWHGLTWPMIAFGTYHFMGLAVHRLYAARKKTATLQQASGAAVLGTYVFVLMSFPLLVLPLSKTLQFYAALAGM